MPKANDPLAAAVADFRAAWGAYCDLPDDPLPADHPWRAAWVKLEAAPTPTTRAGAVAALRLVIDDTTDNMEAAHRGLLEAVVRFLDAA